jgi:hypothetical protein
MKYTLYTLVAIAVFFGSFAGMYRYGIETSSMVKADAVVCATTESLAEAQQAQKRSDYNWLRSIVPCSQMAHPVAARVLACDWLTCRIRLLGDLGETAVGYTSAMNLSH